MKTLFPIILGAFTLLLACGNNQSLCTCIEAGDAVNQLSESFFHREYSVLGKDSLDALIAHRDSLCEEFQLMSGEEMLKLKENCPSD